MKPNNPTQAAKRWIPGLSITPAILPGILWRSEMRVNSMKKTTPKPSDTAIKAGVVAVGADRRSGALLGKTERSARASSATFAEGSA